MSARAHKTKVTSRTAIAEIPSGLPRRESVSWKIWLVLSVVLIALISFAFAPLRSAEFVNYDDPDYVSANPVVQQGLTKGGFEWAFKSAYSFNWHPLTWISHMVDCQLFGLDSGRHHLVNVIFHTVNSLLLLWVFARATKQFWPAFFVAAVFALHPLHVESVAWVCERKDVLSTFFWLLTTWFYIKYSLSTKSRGRLHYICAIFAFTLGLLSKPMLVTLPFVLLMMDYWPLKRLDGFKVSPRLLLEKIPFFLLAVASCVVTFLVQRHEGAVASTQSFSVGLRVANALISYARYLGKTFWPTDLIVFYPYPLSWPKGYIAGAVILLLVITAAVLKFSRDRRYLFVGWFWFLGTLVPVIGLVQVGVQSLADRYMYVPMIGIVVAVGWLIHDVASKGAARIVCGCVTAGVVACCTILTRTQARHWSDSLALFQHALDVSSDNVMAHVMLANAAQEKGDSQEAILHYQEALKRSPQFPEVHYNLGNVYVQTGNLPEAILSYQRALQLQPDYFEAHANLGVAFEMSRQLENAVEQFRLALNLRPMDWELYRSLATDLAALGQMEAATDTLSRAIRTNPIDPLLHVAMGDILVKDNKLGEASASYTMALKLQPNLSEVQRKLEWVNNRR